MFREPFPILSVSDVQRSVHFYCELYGFSPSYRWPTEGLKAFAFLKLLPLDIGVVTQNEAEGQIMRRLAKHNLDSASLWEMLMEPASAALSESRSTTSRIKPSLERTECLFCRS